MYAHAGKHFPTRELVVDNSAAPLGLPPLNIPSWTCNLLEKVKSSILWPWNWKSLNSTRVDLGDPWILVIGHTHTHTHTHTQSHCDKTPHEERKSRDQWAHFCIMQRKMKVLRLLRHAKEDESPESMRRPWLNLLKRQTLREQWCGWRWAAVAQGIRGDLGLEHLGGKDQQPQPWLWPARVSESSET